MEYLLVVLVLATNTVHVDLKEVGWFQRKENCEKAAFGLTVEGKQALCFEGESKQESNYNFNISSRTVIPNYYFQDIRQIH